MKELLSVENMRSRFDGEWVLIENPKTSDTLEVQEGTVIWHSKDRDEVYRKARNLKPAHSAILYMGTLPKDAVVVL